jgi:hypothetical protein
MGAVRDALDAVREALTLSAEVKRLAEAVRDQAIELRNQDRRLVRIETLIEVGARRRIEGPPS